MHPDHEAYIQLFGWAGLVKAVQSVAGIIEGIDIDRVINPDELAFLHVWLETHGDVKDRHPFSEIVPLVASAIEDGVLTEDEKLDILWLCDRIAEADALRDCVTSDMRRLHGVLGGIVADRVIAEEELRGLADWLVEHEHLKTLWPRDEVDSLVTAVMADKRISPEEHDLLFGFFAEFVHRADDRTILSPPYIDGDSITGLCAVCPDIEFGGKTFCFTGASSKFTRAELCDLAKRLGGIVSNSVTLKTDYLVVGAKATRAGRTRATGGRSKRPSKSANAVFPF